MLSPYNHRGAARDVPKALGKLLQGIVSPVDEGVAPVGVLDVAFGLLSLVAVDVIGHPSHVVDVLVGVVGLVLS